MRAKDVMTTNVVSVAAGSSIQEAAQLMLDNHISGMPVVDEAGKVIGLISEGDLMHRAEIGTERKRSWWLRLFSTSEAEARDYIREHARNVEDVMSSGVVTVEEETPLGSIAKILEEARIKRVPVVRDGQLVGIVSRANLLRAIASQGAPEAAAPSTDDRSLREAVLKELESKTWATHGALSVFANQGVVEVWGWVESDEERKALLLTAQQVPGVNEVIDHLGSVPRYLET